MIHVSYRSIFDFSGCAFFNFVYADSIAEYRKCLEDRRQRAENLCWSSEQQTESSANLNCSKNVGTTSIDIAICREAVVSSEPSGSTAADR